MSDEERGELQPVYDTSFEVNLDPEEERPQPGRKPVYVDVTYTEHAVRPVIPANLRTWAGIKSTARRRARLYAQLTAVHTVRSPLYGILAAFFSIVGVFRGAWWVAAWWLDLNSLRVEQAALNDDDRMTFFKARREGNARRLFRGITVAAGAVLLLVGWMILRTFGPWWAQALAIAALVPALARVGRPRGRPIVPSALVESPFRTLSSDVVLRAYYAAKLGRPDKPEQVIKFGSRMTRDHLDQGSEVKVILPYGGTFTDVVNAKAAIASGLDVLGQQVYLTRDKRSERTHTLYVTDVDPLSIPAGPTPLLNGKQTDIWSPAPFGLDERGRLVSVFLMWVSILVGAQPRKGKTFSARLLALYAALDPYVRITIVDGKNSPDWKVFRLVAHMMVFGTVPNANDSDPITHLLIALREIKKHIETVNDFLSGLPLSECPEGKLTRALARKYPQLRVWMLVMEEFQVYYELDDKKVNAEVAELLTYIMAVGPSAGVILVGASQKPSGIGAGDIGRLFNRFRDNFTVRFALKCGNRIVSDAVLGGDAYAEGYDASALPIGLEYRGVGILYGATDETPIVRTFLATGADAEAIIKAARIHRENAGTLTGLAAGDEMAREFRDILRDVHGVYYAGEAWVAWAQLATRLADRMPEHYADVTKEAVSAQVRALGAKEKKGKWEGQSLWGVPLDQVEQAMKRREIGGSR